MYSVNAVASPSIQSLQDVISARLDTTATQVGRSCVYLAQLVNLAINLELLSVRNVLVGLTVFPQGKVGAKTVQEAANLRRVPAAAVHV